MSDSQPIGVFDSGLGGLTVVKALREILPRETYIYLGDTARVPYGNKSAKLVRTYTLQIADFLVSKGAKVIVVACNTASALALDTLKEKCSLPIIGVINPGVDTALKITKNGHIGVIGTVATINSGAYKKRLQTADSSIAVTSQPCPLLVPLVEEGWLDGKIASAIIETYLKPINQARVDTLILGCTHYPLLKPSIKTQVNSGMTLIDSAQAVASETKRVLKETNLLTSHSESGSLTCFVTDLPVRFESIGQRFLGAPIDNVSRILLPAE